MAQQRPPAVRRRWLQRPEVFWGLLAVLVSCGFGFGVWRGYRLAELRAAVPPATQVAVPVPPGNPQESATPADARNPLCSRYAAWAREINAESYLENVRADALHRLWQTAAAAGCPVPADTLATD